jgi:hypothetical protein
MPKIVVRYRPMAEQAAYNQRVVEAVFEELAATQPANLTYSTLRLADGTFIHVADVSKGDNPLNRLQTFAAFLDGIGERCEPGHGPDPQQATLIGSYPAPATEPLGSAEPTGDRNNRISATCSLVLRRWPGQAGIEVPGRSLSVCGCPPGLILGCGSHLDCALPGAVARRGSRGVCPSSK